MVYLHIFNLFLYKNSIDHSILQYFDSENMFYSILLKTDIVTWSVLPKVLREE